jgi:hypothetical protein
LFLFFGFLWISEKNYVAPNHKAYVDKGLGKSVNQAVSLDGTWLYKAVSVTTKKALRSRRRKSNLAF